MNIQNRKHVFNKSIRYAVSIDS